MQIRIKIDTGNAAYTTPFGETDMEAICAHMREIANDIGNGLERGQIRDHNGNTSGRWQIVPHTFITPGRASDILAKGNSSFSNYSKWCSSYEQQEVRRLWDVHPNGGNLSFYDILCLIKRGYYDERYS